MASLLVLDVTSPKAALRGHLQRLLLEVRPGTFVGKVSPKVAKILWEQVCENSKNAIAVFAAKNESGFFVATHGRDKREVVDNYGLSLMSFIKTKKPHKIGNNSEPS